MKIENLIAKSNNESLIEHLTKTMEIAYDLACKLNLNDEDKFYITLTAVLHDIGKATEDNQKHIKGKLKKKEWAFHNAVSAAFLAHKMCYPGEGRKKAAITAVLYHHPKFRNIMDNIFELEEKDRESVESIYESAINVFKKFAADKNLLDKGDIPCSSYENKTAILDDRYFLENDNRGTNVHTFIYSNILKFADIMASSQSDYDTYLNIKYKGNFTFEKPSAYDERFYEQKEDALKAFETPCTIYKAGAGFGKTMLGLIYLLQNGKKGYWVCPRNEIAYSSYDGLRREAEMLGISDKVSFALLLTGVFVYGDASSDVIVTNLDNFFDPSLKSSCNERCYTMLFSNCVFDEFHEYASSEAIMEAFRMIMAARIKCATTRSLLLSASPFKILCEDWEESRIKYMAPKNDKTLGKRVHITVKSGSIVGENYKGRDILVLNHTVSHTKANMGAADIMIHGELLPSEKREIIDIIKEHHGKDKTATSHVSSVIATSIISTGLDISFGGLVITLPTPEQLIQAMGRINRWGKDACSEVLILVDETTKSEGYLCEALYDYDLSVEYAKYLGTRLEGKDSVTIGEIESINTDFYENYREGAVRLYNKYKNLKKGSMRNLSNLTYFKSSKKDNDGARRVSSRQSIRSDGSDIQYFALFKDEKGEWIDTPLLVNDRNMIKTDHQRNAICTAVIKSFNGDNSYGYNKVLKRKRDESISGCFEYLRKKATCDLLPLPIPKETGIIYRHYVGLIDKNKKN